MIRSTACALVFLLQLALGISSTYAQTTGPTCPPTTRERPTIVDEKNGLVGTTWTELTQTVMIVIDGVCKWTVENKIDASELRLYLAGHLLEKAAPTAINLPEDYIKFQLQLDPAINRDQWVQILKVARESIGHRVNISVGHPGRKDVFGSTKFITFNVYPSYTKFVVAGLIGLLVALLVLAHKSPLLRTTPTSTGPFSLGLVQMAWWFYLVVACYLYIWLITGEYNTLSEGVLALMGISAATGLGAGFVEGQKKERRAELKSKQTALQARINEIANANPAPGSWMDQDLQTKRSELAKVNADIAALPATAGTPTTRGWIKDLLSDADGVKFHRFQIVIWTVVLGIVFVRLVSRELAMPLFSPTLLGLMGLSSGTYIGFKWPETPK